MNKGLGSDNQQKQIENATIMSGVLLFKNRIVNECYGTVDLFL